jgi:putative effector of murein hydrolase LrgA (UPF0299 family)
MEEETIISIAVIFVPSVLALVLSRYAFSRDAALLLRVTGISLLVGYALMGVSSRDCNVQYFYVGGCRHLPEWLEPFLTYASMATLILFFFIGPVILLISLILEIWARRAAKFPT